MAKRGLGRAQIHDAAWDEYYPPAMASCLMPLIAVLGLLAVGIITYTVWFSSRPSDVRVPLLVDRDLADAEETLENCRLNVRIATKQVTDEKIRAGRVCAVSPPEGREVKVGRTITLTLSAGSEFVTVPQVQELSIAAGREAMRKAGIRIALEEYKYHSKIPYDRIIVVTPKPGSRVRRDSAVNLVVSRGEKDTYADDNTDLRTTVLTFDVPEDAEGPASVRIEVTDADGKHTVYDKVRSPGDSIVQTVQGHGDVTVEVYVADELLLTRKL